MYGRSLKQGAVLTVANWPIFLALYTYAALISVGALFAHQLGPLGGIVLTLVSALCAGSFLASVEAIVRSGKATLEDFRSSFGTYFFDVIGVMFALWIFSLVTQLLASSPYGPAIAAFSSLLVWVLFNAVPELIYLGHHSTMDLLSESYGFITQNWIEWFPLNIALGFMGTLVWTVPVNGILGTLLRLAVAGLFVYFTMVVRGLLFLELADSSRRARIFKHRAGS